MSRSRSGTSARRRPAVADGERRTVLSVCPKTKQPLATHAVLTERELRQLRAPLMFWCPDCRAAHRSEPAGLWLVEDQPKGLAGETAAPRRPR